MLNFDLTSVERGTILPPPQERSVSIKWETLDIIRKALEQEHLNYIGHPADNPHHYDTWTELFRKMRDESERVNAPWMVEGPYFTQEYRDSLRQRYQTHAQADAEREVMDHSDNRKSQPTA